jgi:hypothetical protein
MMLRRACALLLLLALSGCGDGRPKLYPVTGTVLYKDQPVANAQVMFNSDAGRPAQGTTDASGKFTLTSFEAGDGATPGKYKVTVVKLVPTDAADPYSPTTNSLPVQYATAADTPLEEEVKSAPTEVTLKLVDK